MSDLLGIEELRETVRGVLFDRAPDTIDIPDEAGRGFDVALWKEMATLGWLGLAVPEVHGGLALGIGHLAVLYEELGYHLASVPILETMIAATALSRHGDAEMQARWLPAIVTGECRAAVAFSKTSGMPTIGSDNRITGALDHVAFGDVATLLVVPVRGASGIALALLPADLQGVTVTKRPIVDLTRSMARIDLKAVAAPTALLRIDTADWEALADHAAMGIACDAVGGAAALLALTVDFLKMREQFGRPIGSFQALKHRAADWKVTIDAATALTRHAAALLDAGGTGASATASEAKAYAVDTYAAFAGDAVQLHGGIGFTWEHPCHLYLKRVKLSQELYGSSTVHKERAAHFAFDQSEGLAAAPASPYLQSA